MDDHAVMHGGTLSEDDLARLTPEQMERLVVQSSLVALIVRDLMSTVKRSSDISTSKNTLRNIKVMLDNLLENIYCRAVY